MRRPGHDRRFQQVLFGSGQEKPPAGLPYPVPAAADALHGGADRGRAFDERHLVHRADVDAKFQGFGGHHRTQFPGFEARLHGLAQLPRQGAVVGVGERALLAVVDQARELLAQLAVVDEYEGRAVSLDALPQVGGHGLDAPARAVALGPGHVAHARLHALRRLACHDGDRARHKRAGRVRRGSEAADHGRNRGQGRDRGRKGHALEFAGKQCQPLHGGQQKHPALAPGHGMDLVEDDQAHVAEHAPPAARGEQEIQGFRRGDEDFRRLAQHVPPLLGGGVAAADGDPEGRQRLPGGLEIAANPGQGRKQIGAHVRAQGLERRHVDHGHPSRGPRARGQPVQGAQKRG